MQLSQGCDTMAEGRDDHHAWPSLGKPSPRIAAWLSAIIPGSGQIYAGRLLAGVGMLVMALLSLGGMVDYLDFNPSRRGRLLSWGIPALVIYLVNWMISIVHAYQAARSHIRYSRLYQSVIYYVLHSRRAGMLMDTLLWPLFLYSALGVAFDWWGAASFADNFRYWFIFELTGTLLFGFSVAATDDFRKTFNLGRRGELICYVVLYAIAVLVGRWWLRLHLRQLVLAMLIVLPGQIFEALQASPNRRWELSQRAAFSMVAFMVAIPVVGVTMHYIEDPPYRLLSKQVAPQFFSMLLASLYFFLRTIGESWYRRAFGFAR